MLETMVEAIVGMDEDGALAVAAEALDRGVDPVAVLDRCRAAVDKVGALFAAGEYFIPELLLAGEVVTRISEIAKSRMGRAGTAQGPRLGKLMIGTVQGDIHDIGKGIVAFMMDLSGFEVVDLGVDVPPERFVRAVEAEKPDILGLCGLLTLAYDPMKATVARLREAGLRDRVQIMIGGGAIDDEVRKYTAADAYGRDAVQAVALAKAWMAGRPARPAGASAGTVSGGGPR